MRRFRLQCGGVGRGVADRRGQPALVRPLCLVAAVVAARSAGCLRRLVPLPVGQPRLAAGRGAVTVRCQAGARPRLIRSIP